MCIKLKEIKPQIQAPFFSLPHFFVGGMYWDRERGWLKKTSGTQVLIYIDALLKVHLWQ